MTPLDIVAAQKRLAPYLQATPLRSSAWLSSAADARVHLKIESIQLTNSFKIRGALNAALCVLERAGGDRSRVPRIVTASAGNHGRALALASERLGLDTVVFTPRTAPETKRAAIRRHGVELRDSAPDYDSAEQAAREFAASEGALYISPYNHGDVIAGAGTIGLEIVAAMPEVDVVVVPIGGGGLASGIGIALKSAAPRARIIGVEAAASTPFAASLQYGRIVEITPGPSAADGLTGNLEPNSITFSLVQQTIDEVVAVGEDEIATAIRGLAAEEHLIAEGAGAVATAAVLAKHVVKPNQNTVALVTGANIDHHRFAAFLD